jgi:hypothetical protein
MCSFCPAKVGVDIVHTYVCFMGLPVAKEERRSEFGVTGATSAQGNGQTTMKFRWQSAKLVWLLAVKKLWGSRAP